MRRALDEAIDNLRRAQEFRDSCRRDPRADKTGAARDAREWVDAAITEVLTAAEYEEDDGDGDFD